MARFWGVLVLVLFAPGCISIKESDTARTGVEQLLISSAVDHALNKVDLSALKGAKVYVEPKYLDCVDKNYILVALNQRLISTGSLLVEKAEEADAVVQVGSGGVGTDRQELFAGIPEIPLPPPSPIMIPKLAVFARTKANGTAKLVVIAYDAKTKQPVVNPGTLMARSDHKSWKVLGGGPVITGSVPQEIAANTGENESIIPASYTARREQVPAR